MATFYDKNDRLFQVRSQYQGRSNHYSEPLEKELKMPIVRNTYQILESVFFSWQPNELRIRSSTCGCVLILCNHLVVIPYIVSRESKAEGHRD
jgi:hypothetical protein